MSTNAAGNHEEPVITINGQMLTNAQAMTMRVAMENFALFLQPRNVLGDDTCAVLTRAGYIARIAEIRQVMYSTVA